jgi:hypothetical protein
MLHHANFILGPSTALIKTIALLKMNAWQWYGLSCCYGLSWKSTLYFTDGSGSTDIAPLLEGPIWKACTLVNTISRILIHIRYRPGVKNSLADGFSRVISSGSDTTQCEYAIPAFMCADYNSDSSEDLVYSLKTLIPNVSDLPEAIKTQERLDAQHTDSECIAWSANSRLRNSKFS